MKKRYVAAVVFLFALLLSSYAFAADSDTIKIGLFYSSTAKDSVTLACDNGFTIGYEQGFTTGYDSNFTVLQETDLTALTIKKNGDTGVEAEGILIFDEPGSFLTVYPRSGNLFLDGTEYRGGIQFKRQDTGDMTVINIVNIEEYLYSVIGQEMSPSWNIEALKAQAVCARGFAASNRAKFASYGFHLTNDTNSQVYLGVASETDSTRQAVDETQGIVLTYNGQIAETLYFASSGGATANSAHVWGNEVPYLTGVVDPYENPEEATRYNWTVSITAAEIKEILANRGVDIGDIQSVQAVSTDSLGYVTELKFTGTGGDYTVTNSNCRDIFGGKIYSQRYTVTGGGEIQNPELSVLSSAGQTILSAFRLFLTGGSPAQFPLVVQGAQDTAAYAQTAAAGDGSFLFTGHGWGHGVGMSQWGAKAMADQGFSYDSILSFYYPGTQLKERSSL